MGALGLFYLNRVEIGDGVRRKLDAGDEAGAVWPGIDKARIHGAGVKGEPVGAVVLDHVDTFLSGDDQVIGVGIPLNVADIKGGVLGVEEGN